MGAQVFQPFQTFVQGWHVSGVDPPQNHTGHIMFLEPLTAPSQDTGVGGLVGIIKQGVDVAPYGYINDRPLISRDLDICGISSFVLKPPNETGRGIDQGIDLVQRVHEIIQAGVVQLIKRTGNVQLGNAFFRHD